MKEIIGRMKDNKRTFIFPTSVKRFAMTLYVHSKAGYEIVKSCFMMRLPSTDAIRRWFREQRVHPAIDEVMLDHVSEVVEGEAKSGKKLTFDITFDEMGMKKWVYYNKMSGSWQGHVDARDQLAHINNKEAQVPAKKALVFMLVNINRGFKAPCAY